MVLKNGVRDKCVFFICLVVVCCFFMAIPATSAVTLEGTPSSNTADGVSSINVTHTTGTGSDRLMLVGVSANSYNGARTISSVTFTPSGGSATSLTLVGSVENEAGRLAAIYSLLNPPSSQVGTVTVTFSGSVANGIVAGVGNFAGVDQTTPLGTFASNTGTDTSPTVNVTTDVDDFVFDTVFLGAATIGTLAAGGGQTQGWNATIDRVRGSASTELATTTTTTMSWTVTGGATSRYWAIAAVPINPAAEGPELNITGATADGDPMDGDLDTGYILETENNPAVDHLIQFADGTSASETLADEYFGLYLTASSVAAADLKTYYENRGTPEPYLTFLKDAADGTNPFVYIKGTTVRLVDAAKHDLASVDVDMTVPDDYPIGTYTVAGKIKDLEDNETTVTLILKVRGTRTLAVTINKAAGQPDPTNTSPINFTVVFSETVTDFATGDVNLASSTTGGSLVGTVTGSGKTYNVAVSGMTSSGNVIASIDAGVAHDEADNPNSASTSTDNAVGYVHVPPPSLDGDVSSGTGAPTAASVTFSHTTGTASNRLMLVGVSWNCGSTNRTISSATFTPDGGGSALNLAEVKTQLYNWSTNYRYTAIYSLLNPGSGVSGTIDITFSGAVSNGIIAGAANFAGVDQSTPLGTPDGAVGTGTSSSGTPNPSVTLTGLAGNELIFDSVFMGASSTSHTMTADAGQSELWNILGYSSSSTSFNTRGAASTKQATAASVTMSWTTGGYGTTATRWAIAAVPIKPYSEPIDVELSACTARRIENGTVAVEWITQSEIKTAGFFVLRSEDQDFGFTRVHDSIIKATGNSANGASYQFIDINSPKGSCYYRLEEVSLDGQSTFYQPVAVSLASAADNETQVPLTFALSQNYPNPFNPVTKIDYTLPQSEQVTLTIYDLNGRLVKQLVNERQKEGRYSVAWNGTNEQGHLVVSGTYLYRLSAGENIAVHKMVLLK